MMGNFNIQKIIIWLFALLVALLAVNWLYNYLTTGKLVVKTNNETNAVKVVQITDSSSPFSQQYYGNTSASLKPGEYSVTVYGSKGSIGTSKTVTIKSRHKTSLALNPRPLSIVEPVYSQAATSVIANSSQLIFLDTTTRTLQQIDANGIATRLFPGLTFRSLEWGTPGVGVAEGIDNTFYFIQGQTASPLTLPFTINEDSVINYAVSQNGQLYISNGGTVYTKPLQTGEAFKKIYTSDSSGVTLSAAQNAVAIIEHGKQEGANTLTVINGSGKAAKKSLDARQAAWSPDGKHLAVSAGGNNIIFDSSLNQTAVIAAPSVSSLAWLDNDSFFYNNKNQLWSYGLAERQSQNLAGLSPASNITGIYPSEDGSYVYFNGVGSQTDQLFRIGLKGQPVNKSLSGISVFLPENIGVCSLNYANFGKPAITVTYPPATTPPEFCINAAKGELQYYGLDINNFSFSAVPAS